MQDKIIIFSDGASKGNPGPGGWGVVVIKLKVNKVIKSIDEAKRFFDVVRLGFANRRKFLIKNLTSLAKKQELEQIFAKLGLSKTARAQELSVEQWQELAKELHNN